MLFNIFLLGIPDLYLLVLNIYIYAKAELFDFSIFEQKIYIHDSLFIHLYFLCSVILYSVFDFPTKKKNTKIA